MARRTGSRDTTKEHLLAAIEKVREASTTRRIFLLSHVFTADPNEFYAVNATFVTCEDELAKELHEHLDAAVKEFFAERGIGIGPERPPEVIPIDSKKG